MHPKIALLLLAIGSCQSKDMYDVILSHGEPLIKNHETLKLDGIKVKKINKTEIAITGSFVSTFDFDESIMVLYAAYKKAGNDYKLMPYKYGPKSICVFTDEEKMFYPAILPVTNFPPIPQCDFKANVVYTINNYIPDLKNLPPVFESGDYALEVKVFKNEAYINGYRLYGQILNFGAGGLG